MNRKKTKFIEGAGYFSLFDQLIESMYNGKKVRANGSPISRGTIANYEVLRKHLQGFADQGNFTLRIYNDLQLTARERKSAAHYHMKLYKAFLKYLYAKGLYDNYVGLLIRNWRSFYNYLNDDLHMYVGSYHKKFHVPKDEIPVVALTKKQLFTLLYDEELQAELTSRKLIEVRDLFIVGCTVALRYSDLKRLSKLQLQKKEQHYYLDVRAAKTQIETRMLLPSYCVDIFKKYLKRGDHLLPQISLQYFNRKVKELSELIPENDYLHKVRERKGKTIIRQKDPKTQRKLKLSDHISSHTMRRTAISIMLESGMDEILVRRISGHAPNSKEFYRYVRLAQHRLDAETTRVFSFEDMKG